MLLPANAFRKAPWGDQQVRFSTVLYNLPERHQRRKTQWFNAALKGVLEAPKELQDCCSPFLFDGQYDASSQWINVYDVLALLTCSPDSWMNDDLIDEIQSRTGLELPKKANRSRHEEIFGRKMAAVLKDIAEATGTEFTVETQKYFNQMKYRVDFLVTSAKKALNGSILQEKFVIEFDEKFHEEARQKQRDLDRDKWFRNHRKDIKLIRVKHEDMDKWLGCLAGMGKLASIEQYKVHCIKTASEIRKATDLRVITSESAKAAYDQHKNGCASLLENYKRPFVELSAMLDELGVSYSKSDRIFVARGGKYKM